MSHDLALLSSAGRYSKRDRALSITIQNTIDHYLKHNGALLTIIYNTFDLSTLDNF